MKSSFSHLAAALGICIVSIVGYGVWYGTISSKSAVVAGLQDQIDTRTETADRIAAVRATLADIASDEATVQDYFVPEANVVSFINSLEEHGKTLGATVGVLSVSTGGTAIQPLLILSLTITGTFDSVMRTAGVIEYAPYDLSITNLSVSQNAKDLWHADLKMSVGSVPAVRSATTTLKTPVAPLSYAFF